MKLEKKGVVVETDLPTEIVNLKAQGFRVVKPTEKPAEPETPANIGASTVEVPKPGTPRK